MFRIGEFAKLSGLTIDTLYHYEKMKLLVPGKTDKISGYRYYEAGQLITVNQILALKDARFSLEEIQAVLNKNLPLPELIRLLEEKSLVIEEELNKEADRLDRLRTNIFLIKNGGIPLMNEITMKKVEPILTASLRKAFHKTRFDEELTQLWQQVNDYIDQKRGKRTIPCMMLYHVGWEDIDESGVLEVEVVEPITKAFPGDGKIKVYELPEVEKMASIVHQGSFTTIGKTIEALTEWIRQNGYKKAGPMREIYHKGDWVTSDENEYVTEIQIPVE